jgi:hypothetical protein
MLMFDQKEPYVEISFKHGMSMQSGGVPEGAEEFMSAMNAMQDEGKINKMLG